MRQKYNFCTTILMSFNSFFLSEIFCKVIIFFNLNLKQTVAIILVLACLVAPVFIISYNIINYLFYNCIYYHMWL